MIRKYILTIFFIFILTILQATLLVHLQIKGALPNLVLLFFVLEAFFSRPRSNLIFFLAPTCGLFLDFFSSIFGLNLLAFIILGLIFKKFLVLVARKDVFSFAVILFISLVFYQFFIILSFLIVQKTYIYFSFGKIAYNLVLGLILYFFYAVYKKRVKS